MSNKQRHPLLVIAALLFGAVAMASIAYAEGAISNQPAGSKTKTNQPIPDGDKFLKGGVDKSIHILPVPEGDKFLPAVQHTPTIQIK
jgi:hypothetical protein